MRVHSKALLSAVLLGMVATTVSDFNDRAQSARVVGAWQICEHRDFRGRCATLTGDVPDLDAYRLRDAVTSARPVSDPPR